MFLLLLLLMVVVVVYTKYRDSSLILYISSGRPLMFDV